MENSIEKNMEENLLEKQEQLFKESFKIGDTVRILKKPIFSYLEVGDVGVISELGVMTGRVTIKGIEDGCNWCSFKKLEKIERNYYSIEELKRIALLNPNDSELGRVIREMVL